MRLSSFAIIKFVLLIECCSAGWYLSKTNWLDEEKGKKKLGSSDNQVENEPDVPLMREHFPTNRPVHSLKVNESYLIDLWSCGSLGPSKSGNDTVCSPFDSIEEKIGHLFKSYYMKKGGRPEQIKKSLLEYDRVDSTWFCEKDNYRPAIAKGEMVQNFGNIPLFLVIEMSKNQKNSALSICSVAHYLIGSIGDIFPFDWADKWQGIRSFTSDVQMIIAHVVNTGGPRSVPTLIQIYHRLERLSRKQEPLWFFSKFFSDQWELVVNYKLSKTDEKILNGDEAMQLLLSLHFAMAESNVPKTIRGFLFYLLGQKITTEGAYNFVAMMFEDAFEPEVVQALTPLIVQHGLQAHKDICQRLLPIGHSTSTALDYFIAAVALMPKTDQSFIPREFVINYQGSLKIKFLAHDSMTILP